MATSLQRFQRLFATLILFALLAALLPSAAFGQPAAPSHEIAAAPPAQPSPTAEPIPTPMPQAAPQPSSGGQDRQEPGDIPTPMGVQGPIQLDVIAPLTVRAGELITYTIAYTNTTPNMSYSNILIEARWTDFAEYQYPESNTQYCDGVVVSGGQCEPTNTSGPAVQRSMPCPQYASGNRCYQLSSLAQQQSGRFEIGIRLGRRAYPQSGLAPLRPAASARLYLPNTQLISSEDTASTLVIGPVLTLRKTLAPNQAARIYPDQQGTFVLTVGNTTEPADQPNGQLRADARPATDIVVQDYVPAGATYISASPQPESTSGGKLTWRFAGPLNPGQFLAPITVTFRKDDINNDCGRLLNASLDVTSAEYLIAPNSTRYLLPGSSASIGVVTPMVIASIGTNPQSAIYGDSSTISIKVRNYYAQPVTGAQLAYAIQSNATYVGGSASPAPTSAPAAGSTGTVVWTFDMPAGTMDAPTEATFTLQVAVGYTSVSSGGQATLTAPAGIPSACITKENGAVAAVPRIVLTKTTTADPATILNGSYVVTRNQEFPYKITVQNRGKAGATGVVVRDYLPKETGANIVYKAGSARVNGQAIEPTQSTQNGGPVLEWSGLNISPDQTTVITYLVIVNGLDYYDYCNTASATLGTETIQYNAYRVCVRLNPRITLTKTADRATANPGDSVEYTITLKNNEPTAYTVGIIDAPSFNYQSYQVLAGSYDASAGSVANGYIIWKQVSVQPNQTITQHVQMKLPAACVTTNYDNQALFVNAQNNIISNTPSVGARVNVNCGQLRYSTNAANYNAGLGDKILFYVSVANDDKNAASDVQLVDQLPPGFIYVGVDDSSAIKLNPVVTTGRPDGRDQLEWNLPSLAGNATATIAFLARAGDAVGTHTNWFFIRNPGNCGAQCVTLQDGTIASTIGVNLRPLITNEPVIVPETCALPGQEVTYRVTIVNTNSHAYSSTNVTILLPIGLRYKAPVGTTSAPTLGLDALGNQLVVWDNLFVNKPTNAIAAQLELEFKVKIGQVWGDLPTQVTTTSPDGLIPRKEGVTDPIVRVCPTAPAIAKDASTTYQAIGGEVIYQIMLANPTQSPVTTNVTDILPNQLTYLGPLASTPDPVANVAGSTLTWSNITIPAATDTSTGTVRIRFKVRVSGGAVGQKIDNTATADSGQIVPASSTISITVAQGIFVPLAQR